MKTAKRTLALLLTVCLLCSTLFTSAFAAEGDNNEIINPPAEGQVDTDDTGNADKDTAPGEDDETPDAPATEPTEPVEPTTPATSEIPEEPTTPEEPTIPETSDEDEEEAEIVPFSARLATEMPEVVDNKITLTDDITLTAKYVVSADTTLTIDLNGFTLTGPDDNYTIDNLGTLTIIDSGESKGKIVGAAPSSSCVRNYKSLTLNGITVESAFVAVKNEENSTLTVDNCTLTSTYDDAKTGTLLNWGTATVNNSVIHASEKGTAVYASSGADGGVDSAITLNNCDLSGKYPVYARRYSTTDKTTQTVNINGGSLQAATATGLNITFGSTATISGDVKVDANTTKSALKYAQPGANITLAENATIKGKTIEVPENVTLTIPENVTATLSGSSRLVDNGNLDIQGTLDGANIYNPRNKTYYYQMKTALDDVTSKDVNDTLQLQEDITESSTIQVKSIKTVAIDLNGHTLKGDISNAGNLTIQDSSAEGTGYVEGSITTTGDSSKVTVTGGTYSAEIKDFVPAGSSQIQTEDGKYTIGVNTETAVAQIGNTGYDSLAAAVATAKNGDKVTLLKSTEEEDITVASGKNITLDLNGNTLTVKAEGCVSVEGELTIQDSGNDGKITSSDVPMKVTGKVTVNSGIIESTNNYGIYARDGGTVEVNDGTIQSKFAAISGNNTTGNMNFIVNGGTLTAEQGPAIYMPGQTELTITGGTINGGVSLRMGQVNISGGTINAATKDLDDPKEYYNYSGNAWLPDALYVFGGTYKSDDENGNSLNLNITGGTFNCTNGKGSAVAIYDLGKEKQAADIKITGDAVLITNSKEREAYQVLSLKDIGVTEPASGYGAEGNVDQVATAISGGHYSHSVDEKYLDKDKVNAELEKKTGDAPFSYYASVEDALKDAESGDKVKDLTASDEGETPEPVTYYEVTIVYNVDGKANTTELVAENTKFDQPSVSKSGYKLVGFMDSGEYVTFPITIDRDYHLDAIWKKKSSSGGSSSSSSSKTELDLDTGKNGDVSVSPKKPGKGDKVTITVEPDDGYVLDSIKVTDDDGDKIKLTEKGDNKFTFTMPSGEVTIKTTFTKAGGEDAPQFSFIDVSTGDWFAPAVDYVSAKGVMNGSNGYFSPYDNLTRGMIAQIFYNLEGGTGSFAIAYPDVSGSDWYANAVSWVSANGIMSGYGSGLFGANDSVTREQLALTLYSYAKVKGYSTTASVELTAFADGASTSEWAKPAMQWAVANGLFSGKTGNRLDPQGTATRAEVASILMRFCETIAK